MSTAMPSTSSAPRSTRTRRPSVADRRRHASCSRAPVAAGDEIAVVAVEPAEERDQQLLPVDGSAGDVIGRHREPGELLGSAEGPAS